MTQGGEQADRQRDEPSRRSSEHLESNIERAVAERTAELVEAKRQLEAQLAAQRQAEEALRQSEAHYRLLVEHVSDIISRHDGQGLYTYVSPSCRAMLGYEPEQMLGHPAYDFVHPDDQWALTENHELIRRKGGSHPVVFRKRHRDGQYIWAETTTRPIYDRQSGELTEIIAVTRDITERRRTEQNLRLVESAIRQVEEAVVITESELDPPGPRIVFVNPSFTHMTGYTAKEVVGRTPRLLQGPRTSRAVLDHLRRQLSRGEPFEGETINYRKDGREFMLHWHIAPVRDEQGRITHWVAIQRDVTEQKKAEQLARQRQAELAHIGRLSTMGEMASELAHELNQPLAAIANYVQGSLRRLAGGSVQTHELTATLERVAAQADRAGQIIRRLRRFVRKREPQRSAIQVNRLVSDVIELVEPETRHQSIHVQLELDDSLPLVAADGVQIEQVLLNLVRNAIEANEHTPASDRSITLTTCCRDAHTVEVQVRDSGQGIPPHQLSHIFEPFFTTKQRGMGMGLPISQSIAEAHDGKLEASPNRDAGMTFKLLLPATETDKDEPKTIGQ